MGRLRKPLGEDSGGQFAYRVAVAFSTLLVIAITWNIMFPTLEEEVFDYAENEYKANDDYTDYASTYQLIYYVTKYWPVILLVVVLLYLFMSSQQPSHGQTQVRR